VRKARTTARKARTTARKARAGSDFEASTRVETPSTHWNPVYLGEPHVLSRSVPDFIPTHEPEMMDWLQNYINVASVIAPQFLAVYGNPAKFPFGATLELYNNLVKGRADVEAAREYLRSANAYKNIIAYAADHVSVVKPPPPLKPAGTAASRAGLIGMIDWQVRTLREQSGFDQVLAERLGIIPRAPIVIDPNTFDLALRGQFRGTHTRLTWHGTAGLKGILGVRVLCDRGGGHFEIVNPLVTVGHFDDWHALPARPCVWIYVVQLIGTNNAVIGVESRCEVLVAPYTEPKE